jgi:NADPH-dependent curcumin reductase CurA
VTKQLVLEGFLVSNPAFGPKYFPEHQQRVREWLTDGTLKAKLFVTDGIEEAAEGFVGMLEGRNFGKAVLKVK